MLNEQQQRLVAQWFAAGESLDAIQKRIKAEFGIHIRYLDLRLMVSTLPAPTPAETPAQAEPVPYEAPAPESNPAEEQTTGAVGVTFDPVTDPRYAASGTVTFSDGTAAKWIMDVRGQLLLDGLPQGYKVSSEDAKAFRQELLSGLAARGVI